MPNFKLIALLTLPLAAMATPAHAYIGPGAGLGTIVIVLGVLLSIGLALFAILWFPLKRFLKKRKAAKADVSAASSDVPDDTQNA